jgi:hypothetical protein
LAQENVSAADRKIDVFICFENIVPALKFTDWVRTEDFYGRI